MPFLHVDGETVAYSTVQCSTTVTNLGKSMVLETSELTRPGRFTAYIAHTDQYKGSDP